MPKRSVNTGSTGSKEKERASKMTIAAVAASTVDGYLRNASRRMRVPAAEGGRGTRRKLDMVTSAQVQEGDFALSSNTESNMHSEHSAVDDEWDVVELGVTDSAHEMAKQERVTKVEEVNSISDNNFYNDNCELRASSALEETQRYNTALLLSPKREHTDEESVESSTILLERTTMNRIKRERDNDTDEGIWLDKNTQQSEHALHQPMRRSKKDEMSHETRRNHLSMCEESARTSEVNEQENAIVNNKVGNDDTNNDNDNDDNGDSDNEQKEDDDDEVVMMLGARPPLTEEHSRHAEFGRTTLHDPAYAALHEQQDVLAARRRSERVQRTSETITRLLFVLIRGRLLWREAHHPLLLRRLMRVHIPFSVHDYISSTQSCNGRMTESVLFSEMKPYPFLQAILQAQRYARDATNMSQRKLSLAPVWITHRKDGLCNNTSAAVMTLLSVIDKLFVLNHRKVEDNDVKRSMSDNNNTRPLIKSNGNESTSTGHNVNSNVTHPNKHEFTHSSIVHSNTTIKTRNDTNNNVSQSNRSSEQTTVNNFTNCLCKLEMNELQRALKALKLQLRSCQNINQFERVSLTHPVYFTIIFLALAKLSGLKCRLVVAKEAEKNMASAEASRNDAELNTNSSSSGKNNNNNNNINRSSTGEATSDITQKSYNKRKSTKQPLTKMSIFGERSTKRARQLQYNNNMNEEKTQLEPEVKSIKQPTSCFWVEVWSAERQSFVSVNPCKACTTLWGAPYTFSINGNVIMDATARYCSKFSTMYAMNRRLGRCRQYAFLWRHKLRWHDNREVVDILLNTFCAPVHDGSTHSPSSTTSRTGQCTRDTEYVLERERRQLEALMYAEAVPTTLSALHRHPLFVIESDLARHEAIYPKTTQTTVGSVRGQMVYKRTAIVNLRSCDGWLREGRSIKVDEKPYKIMPPPLSRPFAAPSQFYGRWQTRPFAPLPLQEDHTIPLHGRSHWYILLDKPAPPGLVHLNEPQIARVARRMQLEFGLAVTSFVRRRINEHRRGHWEAVIDGIVVKESDSALLLRAYREWVQLTQEQEAAKRHERAMHWWLLLAQRILAMERLQSQYLRGREHGALPSM